MRSIMFSRLAILLCISATLPGSTLFVGFNTWAPVQLYDMNGHFLQDFGPAGAIAAFPAGSDYFSITPASSLTSSVVQAYTSSQAPASSFTIADLLTDGSVGPGNSLLFSAYDGTVYRVNTSGAVLASWSSGYTHVGVASDGTNIYTTEGDSNNLIDIWSPSGTHIGQIATPFAGLYGLGYDASTGNFWAGSTNFVYELSTTGALLATLNLVGDSHTPSGAVHDGLEVGSLIVPPPPTVPEPASLLLLLGGFIALAGYRLRLGRRLLKLCAAALGLAGASFGSISVTLTPSITGSAPVGTTVVWTTSAHDTANANATFNYQFSVGRSGEPLQVRRDFYHFNTFPWTPSNSEGLYDIQVIVRSSTGGTGTAMETFSITSRVTGGSPVVSRTKHPLVALYSLPPCPAAHAARVRFKQPSDTSWQATPFKTCNGTTSLNFYVAGMRRTTTYLLQHDVYNGPFDSIGPVLSFTTGDVPSSLGLPAYTVVKASPPPNNTAYPVLMSGTPPYATDAAGNVIWYLPRPELTIPYFTRPVKGGGVLIMLIDQTSATGGLALSALLREYDLAGNQVRETNYAAVSRQLTARGADPITSFHHEALRLPDGSTAVIASVEKVEDQGAGPVDVVGDMAVVLDSNLQVKFSWNEFDHLEIGRPALLGETCRRGNFAGCAVPVNPNYSVANDWTHSNSLWLAPDGNMIVSIRHQDWVVKFRYANGSGDGALLWKLGHDGDFTISAPAGDPYPWFSHQHDAEYASNGLLTLFDNGNTRVRTLPGHSRGQALRINGASKTATLEVNLDLGDYSGAVGVAQLLSNGNFFFDLGFLSPSSKMREFSPSNTLEAEFAQPGFVYRSFRMRSLYSQY